MGKESQIIDFVFQAQTGKFRKELEKTIDKFIDMEKAANTALGKAVAKGGVQAAKGISKFLEILIEASGPWLEHVQTMEDYRKQAGLTREEISAFSAEVVSSSTKYGVALNRVATMSAFLSKGLGRSRTEAAKLSAAMADIGDATGLTDETAMNFAHTLSRQFNLSASKSIKITHALGEQARSAHVPLEDVISVLNENKEALMSLPIGESTKQLGSLTTSLMESGATLEQTIGIIEKFGDTESRIFKSFMSSGGNVEESLRIVTQEVKRLNEQYEVGAMDHIQYSINLERLGRAFDLSRFQILKASEAVDLMGKKMAIFDEAEKKSAVEIQETNLSRLSTLASFSKRMEFLKAGFGKWFEDMYGPNAAIWGWLDNLVTDLESAAVSIKMFWQTTVSEAKMAYNILTDLRFMKDIGESQVTSSLSKAKSPEEKIAYFKSQFDRTANEMEARGVDRETIGRFRRERSEDLNQMRVKEGVPEAMPNSALAVSSAETVKATKDLGIKLDRLIGLQEDQTRTLGLNRLDSRTAAMAGNSAFAASKIATR